VDQTAAVQGADDMYFVRRFIRDYTRGSVSSQAFYEKMARDGGAFDSKYRTFPTSFPMARMTRHGRT